MLSSESNVRLLENESCRCWLLTFHQTTVTAKETNSQTSALQLYFITSKGETVTTYIPFAPYMYIVTAPGMERDVTFGLCDYFKSKIKEVTEVTKEDLGLLNHLSGIHQTVLKVSFQTQNDLMFVRNRLAKSIASNTGNSRKKRHSLFYTEKELDTALSETIGQTSNQRSTPSHDMFANSNNKPKASFWSKLVELREHDVPYDLRVCIDLRIFGGTWYDVEVYANRATLFPASADTRQRFTENEPSPSKREAATTSGPSSLPLIPSMFRYISFDIETTKLPLKFPQPATDQIFMISIMYETQRAELLINKNVVSEDIQNFHYFPRMQQRKEVNFTDSIESGGSVAVKVQNLSNEAEVITAFQKILRTYQPHVVVTYNGDNFDFPFLATRAKVNNIALDDAEEADIDSNDPSSVAGNSEKPPNRKENANKFGFGFLTDSCVHIDCYYWVKRDSYLPMGSQSLKAVTKIKLNYNPVEIDPEEMLPLARRFPQRMASYSISDVVATGELYQKYIQPFTFSLCTIIPYAPQKILRRGSGALCEALLMKQASDGNILYPNRAEEGGFGDSGDTATQNTNGMNDSKSNGLTHAPVFDDYKLRFHNGNLIDSETYIGGIVEALESGVFRCDLDINFHTNARAYDDLIVGLDEVLTTVISKELKKDVRYPSDSPDDLQIIEDVKKQAKNYESVREAILSQLRALRNAEKIRERPNILHLDVGAMYPNIILTNRLQPTSIVNESICSSCVFNDPENLCKRRMDWIWRGTMFTATRDEVLHIIDQLEKESFPYSVIRRYLDTPQDLVDNDVEDQEAPKGADGPASASLQRHSYKRPGDTSSQVGHRTDRQNEKRHFRDQSPSKKGHRFDFALKSNSPQGDFLFTKLPRELQKALLKKRITEYCKKGHKKLHVSQEIRKTSVVCMRENSFYVDTVQLFRDRRYEYKAQTREWKKKLTKIEGTAQSSERDAKLHDCRQKVVQYESLQTAHKCILNSFYGYVMRTGARWGSIEMAGIVTHLGGQIIHLAQEFAQSIGVPLELDTDGIWCCLPSSFPLNFTLEIEENGVTKELGFNYPCAVLNTLVQKKFSNEQYQDLTKRALASMEIEDGPSPDESLAVHNDSAIHQPDASAAVSFHTPTGPQYSTRPPQCGIEFEVDGPHHSMILPASQDEGGSIKKRYAVYYKDFSNGSDAQHNYKLGELKGFELKRRGELKILKEFQENVFDKFMLGTTLTESYYHAAMVASRTLNILLNRGFEQDSHESHTDEDHSLMREVDDEDILEMVTESRTLSKELSEYPAEMKSLAITTAKRLLKLIEMASQNQEDSEFAAVDSKDSYSKNTKGLSCSFVVSKYPIETPVAERALPTILFSDRIAEVTRKYWLTKWTGISLVSLEGDGGEVPHSNPSSSSERFKYLKMVLDWDYYITRFSGCVQKIITIPAALQGLLNPIPKISHPSWLESRLKRQQAARSTSGGRKQGVLTFGSVTDTSSSDKIIELKPTKPPLPSLPALLHQQLRGNLSVEGTVRRAAQDPMFGVWLVHAARQWRATPARVDDGPLEKHLCAQNRSQSETGSSTFSDKSTSSTLNKEWLLQSPIHILQLTSQSESVRLHTMVGDDFPLTITFESVRKVVINVTQPIDLTAYTSRCCANTESSAVLEAMDGARFTLPFDQPVLNLYTVLYRNASRDHTIGSYDHLIECLKRNTLPTSSSRNNVSHQKEVISISEISNGGFICGLYPSQENREFDMIAQLGNIVRLNPEALSKKSFVSANPWLQRAEERTITSHPKRATLLESFSGGKSELRVKMDDLVSAPPSTHSKNTYEIVAQQLRPFFLYHITKDSKDSAGEGNDLKTFCVVLVDVHGERAHVFIATESEGDGYTISQQLEASQTHEESQRKRKTKSGRSGAGKGSDLGVQKTTCIDYLSLDDLKGIDETISARVTEVHAASVHGAKWNLPRKFNLVTYSSRAFVDAVKDLNRDVDAYVTQFHLKHASKVLLVAQSNDMPKDPSAHSQSMQHESHWRGLLLPSVLQTVPVINVPFNTSDRRAKVVAHDSSGHPVESPELCTIITRCMHRYLFATLSISYQLELSRFGRIPVCNFYGGARASPDAIFWDVTYARLLTSHGHIWLHKDGSVFDSAYRPPTDRLALNVTRLSAESREIVNASLFGERSAHNQYGVRLDTEGTVKRENTVYSSEFSTTWCVEFAIENLDAAAILVGINAQERPIEPTQSAIAPKDFFSKNTQNGYAEKDLRVRFRLLRLAVQSVYESDTSSEGLNVTKALLQNVSRWIQNSSEFHSNLYDPAVSKLFIHNARKALAIILLYFQKCIGGRIIFANKSRIIVGTDKKTIDDCFSYANYALGMCHAQSRDPSISAFFKYATLRVTSMWCPLLFINEKNFIGRRFEIDASSVTLKIMNSTIEYQWESSEILPHAQQRKMFVAHLFHFMILSSNLVDASGKMPAGRGASENGPSREVALSFVISGIHKYLQTSFQQQLLKELDLFTHIGGDVCKYAGLFLRYLCIILQATKTIEEKYVNASIDIPNSIQEIMESVYQNACRILDAKVLTSDTHDVFLQSASSAKLYTLFTQMELHHSSIGRIGYILPYTILRDFTCPFCHSVQNVYLLHTEDRREKEHPGEASDEEKEASNDEKFNKFVAEGTHPQKPSVLQCLYCTYLFDPKSIEWTLIETLNAEIAEYFSQDIVCQECGICKEMLLARQCSACVHGEIQCNDAFGEEQTSKQQAQAMRYHRDGKYTYQSIGFESMRERLLGRKIIAAFRQFGVLAEITKSFTPMFFGNE